LAVISAKNANFYPILVHFLITASVPGTDVMIYKNVFREKLGENIGVLFHSF
jgi:hypothetical protein